MISLSWPLPQVYSPLYISIVLENKILDNPKQPDTFRVQMFPLLGFEQLIIRAVKLKPLGKGTKAVSNWLIISAVQGKIHAHGYCCLFFLGGFFARFDGFCLPHPPSVHCVLRRQCMPAACGGPHWTPWTRWWSAACYQSSVWETGFCSPTWGCAA